MPQAVTSHLAEEDGARPAPRALLRNVRADPDHLAEHVTLFAVDRLRGESRRYAERVRKRDPDVAPVILAERVRAQAALISRTDGAVAGTPFLFALVPAYVAVLWEQARMVLRIAALNGRDLDAAELPAELLALRGVYASSREAVSALGGLPTGPHRRLSGGLSNLFQIGRRVAILAGFLSPKVRRRSRLVRALALLAGAIVWVLTWIFPTAFMVLMSYSCETSTRTLGERAIAHYAPLSAHQERQARRNEARAGRRHRIASATLLGLSLAVPIAVLALGVMHRVHEFTWQRTLVGLIGLALVLALFAVSTRRLSR